MGGTASSQATDDGNIRTSDQTNFGLVNMSSESGNSWNLVEIITCLFVAILLLYLFSYWCQKRRQKKLARLAHALQNVRIEPDVARLPMFEMQQRQSASQPAQPPPPAYPAASPVYPTLDTKPPAEALGAELMSRYT